MDINTKENVEESHFACLSKWKRLKPLDLTIFYKLINMAVMNKTFEPLQGMDNVDYSQFGDD